jgi:hypothetical protein
MMSQPIKADYGLILGKGLLVQKFFFLGFSSQNELGRYRRRRKIDNYFV